MALVIYLISNLMKLTIKNPVKDFFLASLGNSIIKRAVMPFSAGTRPYMIGRCFASAKQKNTPQQIVGTSNLFYAQFVVS